MRSSKPPVHTGSYTFTDTFDAVPPAPWDEESVAEADLGLEPICAEDLGVAAGRVVIGPNRGVKG